MARTPSFGTLSKWYSVAVASVAIGMVGFMVVSTPDLEWNDWGIPAFALSLYLLFAGYQFLFLFLFLVAFTTLRRHFFLATAGCIALETALNFGMFGIRDGIRSLLMFVIAAAVLCIVLLLSFGGQRASTR